MKALFINGSPRKNGNTAQLLKRAMDGAREAGAEVELVNLYDRNLNYKGCMSCFACKVKGGKKGVCSFKDDLQPIQLEMNYKDRRIILPKTEGEVLEPIKVLRADIDYNKHLNNANYVRMAMELLPEDFVVRGLRVEYRVAAKLGDCLIPTIYKIVDGIIISLSIGSEVSAIIEFNK
ncbi:MULTISPECIES: NAD(P)H-dependent oxidoreductase [Prevotellaceae]|uniref:NAD(P)H-dependent oxidoreductase n=1 Tax=Prevotellaceae TaxID=171552 RepID=UPI000B8354E5|nr:MULTISPECIES: NAD(P)H-dependent oxidoreductase [Prevotellaceae]QVJ81524.1 NAD(P)H-dependent oxidoreductase [Xylanibacter ruminicola]